MLFTGPTAFSSFAGSSPLQDGAIRWQSPECPTVLRMAVFRSIPSPQLWDLDLEKFLSW
jgi:hypothetical protein